jgi:hypothetical protein
VGSFSACHCLPVLVYWQASWPTWGCGTTDRYMVRRRSTVRFRKGAPQVRRVFRLPIRGPLPMQGEGPEFYSESNAQVRADVSLPRRCATIPVGRKISTIATLTGSFALARERPPSGVQCRWGANRGARSLSGGPDVVAASGRLALWSHLAGQAVASPGGGRDPHSIAPGWPQQFGPAQAVGYPGPSWNRPHNRDRRYCRNSVPGSFMTYKARRVPRLCKRGRADPGQAARWISGRLRRG